MKQAVGRKSRAENRNVSRLPEFTEAEKIMNKGRHILKHVSRVENGLCSYIIYIHIASIHSQPSICCYNDKTRDIVIPVTAKLFAYWYLNV